MKKKIGFAAIAILALTTTITTFAFLTAQTDPLTNTFTVGKTLFGKRENQNTSAKKN